LPSGAALGSSSYLRSPITFSCRSRQEATVAHRNAPYLARRKRLSAVIASDPSKYGIDRMPRSRSSPNVMFHRVGTRCCLRLLQQRIGHDSAQIEQQCLRQSQVTERLYLKFRMRLLPPCHGNRPMFLSGVSILATKSLYRLSGIWQVEYPVVIPMD